MLLGCAEEAAAFCQFNFRDLVPRKADYECGTADVIRVDSTAGIEEVRGAGIQ